MLRQKIYSPECILGLVILITHNLILLKRDGKRNIYSYFAFILAFPDAGSCRNRLSLWRMILIKWRNNIYESRGAGPKEFYKLGA
jgi:hypothetical protein